MPPDLRRYLPVLRTYLLIRRWPWLAAVTLGAGVLVAVWGSVETAVPAATSTGGTVVPFWRFFTVAAASVPVLTLSSSLAVLESSAGVGYHRLRAAVLAAAFFLSSACMLLAATVGVGASVTPMLARALLAWFGLALISGRLLGWGHSWILPWATLCAVIYWGYDSGAGGFRWWEFTAQPIGHRPSLLLTAGLFLGGLLAYALSPWRTRHLRRRVVRLLPRR